MVSLYFTVWYLHCYTAQEMKEMEARLDCKFGKESDHKSISIDIELHIWNTGNKNCHYNKL